MTKKRVPVPLAQGFHPGCRADLGDAPAYEGNPVVVADHVITSRGLGSAIAFGLSCVEGLQGAETANRARQAVVA